MVSGLINLQMSGVDDEWPTIHALHIKILEQCTIDAYVIKTTYYTQLLFILIDAAEVSRSATMRAFVSAERSHSKNLRL